MISGPTSYLPTMDLFLAHWALVDADPLAAPGLVTRDSKTRANLVTLRAALDAAASDVQSELNGKEISRARVENAKAALLARTQEFGRRLRGVLPMNSPYLRAMPELPTQTAAQEVFLKPMRDVKNLWSRLDGESVEIVLAVTYSFTRYEDDLAALAGEYAALNKAEMDLKISRGVRNNLQKDALAILSSYRPAVEGLFPPGSPLVVVIPRLYSPDGHTPDAVTASGSYDAAETEAVITFTESTEAELESYQIRGVPGPEYDGEDEVVLATLPAGAPREFRTGFSLSEPGTQASFKVYVILTTGNERGSKAVTVARE